MLHPSHSQVSEILFLSVAPPLRLQNTASGPPVGVAFVSAAETTTSLKLFGRKAVNLLQAVLW